MNRRKFMPLITLLLLVSGCTVTEYSYTTLPNHSEIKTSIYGDDYPQAINEVSSGATGSYSESGYSREYHWY